jgi:excinuclease ABC subunit A
MLGIEHLDKVIDIDQSPIGRTPRSNPATYTGVFGPMRDPLCLLPEAKAARLQGGALFVQRQGRALRGLPGRGIIKIEMQFLPDVYVPCEVCHGSATTARRWRSATKAPDHRRRAGHDRGRGAGAFSRTSPPSPTSCETLHDVGLGYIRLGQPATTLSGGEAQRVKLAKELSRRATGRTLYILDEPTVGLHIRPTWSGCCRCWGGWSMPATPSW